MKKFLSFILFFSCLFSDASFSDEIYSEKLNALLKDSIGRAKIQLQKNSISENDLAITLLDVSKGSIQEKAQWQGDKDFYAASVMKLFLLAALEASFSENKLNSSTQLLDATERMIKFSSNDATSYVMDLLTNTTSGPELPDLEFADFVKKRKILSEYFASLGYKKVNILHKPATDKRYGREAQIEAIGTNTLTTNETARLIAELVSGQFSGSKERVLSLLKRNPTVKSGDPDDQANAFIGKYLPKEAKYYSKAGWTSQVRHDAAYIEMPNAKKCILVIFTQNNSQNKELIPQLAKEVLNAWNAQEKT